MEDYTFLCIRRDGSIPAIDILACANEGEALKRVPELFAEHRSCDFIEVWRGAQRLVEAQRAG